MNVNANRKAIQLRPPCSTDGQRLHALVSACPPLDQNSLYCNLLQCTHFSGTSVVGESAGRLVSAISGYLVPGREDTLFVWQVAVADGARGQGLGGRMLQHILERPVCAGVTHLETTVTASNEASWALFKGFARRAGAELNRAELFSAAEHFGGQHESELLARIGPLARGNTAASPVSNIDQRDRDTA